MRKAIKHIRSLGYFDARHDTSEHIERNLPWRTRQIKIWRDAPVNIGNLTPLLCKRCTISTFARDKRRKISSEYIVPITRAILWLSRFLARQQAAQYNIVTCETRNTFVPVSERYFPRDISKSLKFIYVAWAAEVSQRFPPIIFRFEKNPMPLTFLHSFPICSAFKDKTIRVFSESIKHGVEDDIMEGKQKWAFGSWLQDCGVWHAEFVSRIAVITRKSSAEDYLYWVNSPTRR